MSNILSVSICGNAACVTAYLSGVFCCAVRYPIFHDVRDFYGIDIGAMAQGESGRSIANSRRAFFTVFVCNER
ncbi:MAG: hypothetical protein WAZ34_12440 [Rhodocyclaceae bacterium]